MLFGLVLWSGFMPLGSLPSDVASRIRWPFSSSSAAPSWWRQRDGGGSGDPLSISLWWHLETLLWCSSPSLSAIMIFEVGDVVSLDTSRDVGASNNRRLAALYCNSNSGFEEIMGLVDRIVKIVSAPHINFGQTYYVPSSEPEFFTKRQCKIVMSDGKQVGYLGIVHAEVLRKFGIPDPCTFVEIDIEALL